MLTGTCTVCDTEAPLHTMVRRVTNTQKPAGRQFIELRCAPCYRRWWLLETEAAISLEQHPGPRPPGPKASVKTD